MANKGRKTFDELLCFFFSNILGYGFSETTLEKEGGEREREECSSRQ